MRINEPTKYGYWTPTGREAIDGPRKRRLEVICCCGTKRWVNKYVLRKRESKSCGCMTKSMIRKVHTRHGHASQRKQSPTYDAWRNMLNRCKGAGYPSRHRYEGRGITVCDRWKTFENFLTDMGEKPSGHDLDRKDNNLGYTPENCRWVPHAENCRNRATSRVWIVEGREYPSLKAASEGEGCSMGTIGNWCRGKYKGGKPDPATRKAGCSTRLRYPEEPK